jgi:hypothetical protein
MESILGTLMEAGVLGAIVAIILMWKRQDDQRHAAEIVEINQRYEKELTQQAERYAAEKAAMSQRFIETAKKYTTDLTELRTQGADRDHSTNEMLLTTLSRVTVALEENTKAISDSAETIKVAARITDAFVKKAINGNGKSATDKG